MHFTYFSSCCSNMSPNWQKDSRRRILQPNCDLGSSAVRTESSSTPIYRIVSGVMSASLYVFNLFALYLTRTFVFLKPFSLAWVTMLMFYFLVEKKSKQLFAYGPSADRHLRSNILFTSNRYRLGKRVLKGKLDVNAETSVASRKAGMICIEETMVSM